MRIERDVVFVVVVEMTKTVFVFFCDPTRLQTTNRHSMA